MTGLLDIAPERVSVDVLGQTLDVQGITVEEIAELLRRFPGLGELFAGGGNAQNIASALPALIAAVIAAGVGHAGDTEHELAARRLPAEAQSKLFGAILKLTMPSGVGPFVEGLATAFGSPIPATTSATGSLPQSSS